MGYERTICVTVSEDNIRGYVDDEIWDELVEAGAVPDAVDLAINILRREIFIAGTFCDICREAVERTLG